MFKIRNWWMDIQCALRKCFTEICMRYRKLIIGLYYSFQRKAFDLASGIVDATLHHVWVVFVDPYFGRCLDADGSGTTMTDENKKLLSEITLKPIRYSNHRK